MKTYDVQIEIRALIGTVWLVLTQTMPQNPAAFGILRIEGKIAPGARLRLWSELAPRRAFGVTVDVLDNPGRMVWRGGMPCGLFTGTRTFALTSNGDKTIFHMQEVFTGALSGMITRSMPDLTPSFTKFAQTLKAKAETP